MKTPVTKIHVRDASAPLHAPKEVQQYNSTRICFDLKKKKRLTVVKLKVSNLKPLRICTFSSHAVLSSYIV